MSIILDDIEAEFRAARSNASLRKTASSGPGPAVVMLERRLPKVGVESRLLGSSVVGSIAAARDQMFKSVVGTADVTQTEPQIRNPLLSLINFHFPYDRKTLNQWIRYYARTDPFVGNCLDLNGQFPVSDFHFTGTSDQGILRQFEELKERCNMLQHAFEESREEEEIGECHTFWQWDEDDLTWTDFTILNPDRLEVKEINWGSGMNAFYSLDPPDELKSLMRETDPQVQEMLDALDPAVLEALSTNRRIPLDAFNVTSLVRKASPYDARGTSPVMRALKALMYKDKLIEAQYAIAEQQITPVQLWKIGDPANGYMPNEEQLQAFRALLQSLHGDPNAAIVSHAAVQLELIGYTGKLLPILPELEWVSKQIMVALFTNEATITGSGPSYGAAVVPFKILQGRYQAKRDRMVTLRRKKLLKPFAEAREIYQTSQAELSHRIRTKKLPFVPQIEWNFKLDLTDSAQKMQFLLQLRDKMSMPMKVLCDLFNLDYEATRKALKDEEGTVFDPAYQAARKKKAEATGQPPSSAGSDLGGALGAPSAGGGAAAGGAGASAAPSGGAGSSE